MYSVAVGPGRLGAGAAIGGGRAGAGAGGGADTVTGGGPSDGSGSGSNSGSAGLGARFTGVAAWPGLPARRGLPRLSSRSIAAMREAEAVGKTRPPHTLLRYWQEMLLAET